MLPRHQTIESQSDTQESRNVVLNNPKTILAILMIQVASGVFLIADIFLTGTSVPFVLTDWIKLGAAFGLFLGVFLGAVILRDSIAKGEAAEVRLAELSGAFMDLIDKEFLRWKLTSAERDVAFCLMKGLSTSDISSLRKTSEGTVKAQSAAIYRKAGVANRAQLVSLFIDDLIEDEMRIGEDDQSSALA